MPANAVNHTHLGWIDDYLNYFEYPALGSWVSWILANFWQVAGCTLDELLVYHRANTLSFTPMGNLEEAWSTGENPQMQPPCQLAGVDRTFLL